MRTWIKLYTEILHDPKMGRMTDRQWRVCVSLFAMAGEKDEDGALPPVSDMAWTLRLPEPDVLAVLEMLERVDIARREGDDWLLIHFEERNPVPPSSTNEAVKGRVKKSREKKAAEEAAQATAETCNEGVTPLHAQCNEDVTTLEKNREEKNREDIEREHASAAANVAYGNAAAPPPSAPAEPANGPDAKPKRKRADGSAKLSNNATYELAVALAEVCGMDIKVNTGRLTRAAKQLSQATTPSPSPALVRAQYGANGWWWADDWRGQKGEFPEPETVLRTWGHWQIRAPARAANNGRAPSGKPGGMMGAVMTRMAELEQGADDGE